MSFLKINDLSVDYKMRRETIYAAKNINIDVNRGEILGLVGESGSGKSTVGNAIINLIDEPGKVSNGSIVLDGIDIHKDTENITKYRGNKIGLIFQDPQTSLNPILTIGDQLIETIQTHLSLSSEEAKNKSINLLKEVGIKDAESRFNNYPHQFSGGMRQRVVISLALCCEPELLIADEPTTALDVSIQSQILELIKRLTKERNLAVILITHDMGVIAETTDRVAVMKNGVLVEIGQTKEILTKPKEIYTRSLVSSVPPTDKKISRFKIIEKEKKSQTATNIKILNRWVKKEISNKDLVQIKNLSKTFDDSFFIESSKNSVMAVNDVSFNIKEGQSFGLVGESGSGKSTIAKMIVNLFRPTLGDIYFNDVCITKIKSNKEMMKFRKQIQMIFQDPYSSLNGRLKVKDIVSEPIKLHNPSISSKDIDSYIYDLLESVELTQQSAERYPHEFSGGQRQRISIARALATQPRLLVCDEPTSALDVSIQAQILNLLKDLQEQLNLTILFISHDLPVVRQMCDRIAVLKNGKLCEISKTEELFKNPSHDYTKELLTLMPKIESIYN
jgi:peptide/nickel transport system ATP-binding protein